MARQELTKSTGCPLPQSNCCDFPKQWTDVFRQLDDLAVVKVNLYLLRHTYEHNLWIDGKPLYTFTPKYTKEQLDTLPMDMEPPKVGGLSVDDFLKGRELASGKRVDKGIGLTREEIINALKESIELGLIKKRKLKTDLPIIYYLNMED